MNNNTPVNSAPSAHAEMNRLRTLQIQQQQALAAQQQAARRAGGDAMPPPSAGEPPAEAPIAKDTFVKEGVVGTEAQRQAAYEEFDTDGVEGLSEEEFEAAYDSLMETAASQSAGATEERPRPKLPMQKGQKDPSYLKDNVNPPLDPVRQLQTDLSVLKNKDGQPYFQYEQGPTGGYFEVTAGAVKQFQKEHGLEATGSVDDATYDAIQTELAKMQGAETAASEAAAAAAASAEAKQAIDNASITGTRPASGSPDRIEEMAKRDQDTLMAAQEALEKIPADDPQRAMYQEKVDGLQAAYDAKWWSGETGDDFRAAQATIERITSMPPDPATLTANGVCHTTPEAYEQAVQASLAELDAAYKVLPDGDPVKAQLEAKVDQYVEAAAQAQPTDEQLVSHKTRELEAALTAKAGQPVKIEFEEGAFSPEDQLKQLALLEEAVANDTYPDEMWQNFTTIEFNTYENYVNDANPDNLNKYTEVMGSTLRINNPDDDGITAAELDKQRRALDHTLQTGRGS